jgi:tetratricopeptide (TPR) repeat protein
MKKILHILCLIMGLGLSATAQRTNLEALGKEYFNNTEYEKAEDIYKKLHQNDPGNGEYYSKYYQCLMVQKKYELTEKLVKKMLKRTNGYPTFYIDLGLIYDSNNQTDKSKKQYTEAINRINPDLTIMVDVVAKFTNAQLYDEALRAIQKGRLITGNASLMSMDATKIYSLQNNKQGIIEEQLNTFEQNAYEQDQIQQNFQDYFNDEKDYDLLKNVLLQRLQKFPDQQFYSDLLIWTFIQQQNFDAALMQSIAMDKRMGEDGQRLFQLGQYCKNNKKYDVAIKTFRVIIEKGNSLPYYSPSRSMLLSTQKEKITSSVYTQADLITLEKDYQQYFLDFGEQTSTAEAMREYASLLALYMNRSKDAIEILEKIIEKRFGISSFLAQCKLDLGDYYLYDGDVWEAAMMYGQVDKAYKDDPLGQMAKYKNAKLSYYAAEFEWAKAQLDILKASTSQLIANDALNLSLLISDNENVDTNQQALRLYANADLLIYQHRYTEALKKLDSINVLFPENDLADDILWMKANIEVNQQNFNKAIELYKVIVDKHKDGIWADDALFTIADIYERKLQNTDLAMKAFQQIIDEFSGSMYMVEARKRFRSLRGS